MALAVSVWFGAGNESGASLWSRSGLGLPFGDIGVANLIGAVVLVACAGALGIVLARLLPWGLVPIVAVVVVGILTAALGADGHAPGVAGLSPVASGTDLPAFLSPVAQGWHVVYLVGLGAIAAGVAFLVDRERRWGLTVLAIAAVLVTASVLAQSRTYAGDTAARLADLVTDPATHQRCIGDDSVMVCHYPELDEIAAGWRALAGPVRDGATAGAGDGPGEIHTRVSAEEIRDLPPEVRAELDQSDAFAWVGEAGLHPDLRWGNGDDAAFRALLVAHEIVGLPEPGAPPTNACYAGGQARAAVAVALAGRALPDADHDEFRSPASGAYDDASAVYGELRVTTLSGAEWDHDTGPAVVHSESDLSLGRALLARPRDEVRDVLAGDWGRWTDPSTPTTELAAAFGLTSAPPVPRPDGLDACR